MEDEKLNLNNSRRCKSNDEAMNERMTDAEPVGNSKGRKSRRKPELPEGTKVSAGQVVAIRRRELGWSQEELSWRSGLCSTQISRIERDECIPSVESIEGLEAALEIELYDIFMAEKRQQTKSIKRRKKSRGSKELISNFEKELARKKLAPGDLERLLSATLKSVEDDMSKNNS